LPEIAIERLPLTINTQPSAAVRKETPDAESGAVAARADKASEAAAELVQLRDIEFERFEPPPYPPLSRRLGEQGVVVVRVQVDEQGSPVAVAVHVSSGFARLDEAALRAVRAARFRPYMQGTRARAAYALVPIRFVLS
jgi:protein TonB